MPHHQRPPADPTPNHPTHVFHKRDGAPASQAPNARCQITGQRAACPSHSPRSHTRPPRHNAATGSKTDAQHGRGSWGWCRGGDANRGHWDPGERPRDSLSAYQSPAPSHLLGPTSPTSKTTPRHRQYPIQGARPPTIESCVPHFHLTTTHLISATTSQPASDRSQMRKARGEKGEGMRERS
jgi:hypothetical protein